MNLNPATLRAEAEGFVRAALGGDPEVYVPTCPEWQLRVLVGHLGQEYRWVAETTRTGAAAAVPDAFDADPGPVDAWRSWVIGGVDEFLAAIEEADGPSWTLVGPRPPTFLLRRAVHETTVHRYDASLTAGITYTLGDDLADDGIDERLEVLGEPALADFKPAFKNLRGTGETLQFRTDGRPGWFVTLTPDGITWERKTAPADVTASAPLTELNLILAGRVPADRATISGSRDLLDHWLANTPF